MNLRLYLSLLLIIILVIPVSAQITRYVDDDIIITNGEISYKINDRLGTARILLDANSQIAKTNKVLPYGQKIENTKYKFDFTNKELDKSGLHYFNARYYDSDSSKFLSVDPINDNQAYTYVSNNPMNYVDPTGMDFIFKNFNHDTDYKQGNDYCKKIDLLVVDALKLFNEDYMPDKHKSKDIELSFVAGDKVSPWALVGGWYNFNNKKLAINTLLDLGGGFGLFMTVDIFPEIIESTIIHELTHAYDYELNDDSELVKLRESEIILRNLNSGNYDIKDYTYEEFEQIVNNANEFTKLTEINAFTNEIRYVDLAIAEKGHVGMLDDTKKKAEANLEIVKKGEYHLTNRNPKKLWTELNK